MRRSQEIILQHLGDDDLTTRRLMEEILAKDKTAG